MEKGIEALLCSYGNLQFYIMILSVLLFSEFYIVILSVLLISESVRFRSVLSTSHRSATVCNTKRDLQCNKK